MSPSRAGTRIARSGVEGTNPETTRHPQEERGGETGEEEEGCTSPYNIPPHLSQFLLGFSRRSQTLQLKLVHRLATHSR